MSEEDPQRKHRIFDLKKGESEEWQEIEQELDDLKSESNSLRIEKNMMEDPPEVECTPGDREEVDKQLAEIKEKEQKLYHELSELDEKLMKEAEEEAERREAEDEIEPPRVEVSEEPEGEFSRERKDEDGEKDKDSLSKRVPSKGRGSTYHGPIKENWATSSGEQTPGPKPTSYGGITRRQGGDEGSSGPTGLDWWTQKLSDTHEEAESWSRLEEQLLNWQNEGHPPGPEPTGMDALQIFRSGIDGIGGKELEKTLLGAFKAWVHERYPEEEHSQWRPWHIWTRFTHWAEYLSEDQIKQIANTYGPFLEAEAQGDYVEAPPLPDVGANVNQIEAHANEVFNRRNEGAGLGNEGQLGPPDTVGEDNYDMGISSNSLDNPLPGPNDDPRDPLEGPPLDPWRDWLDPPSLDPRDRWLEKKY